MVASYGRGGAGNISNVSQPSISYNDLLTPTLKTSIFTTGRGGTGNMARNSDPAEARKRQDVEPVVRRPSTGVQYAGRGGAGNIFHADEIRRNSVEHAIDDNSSTKSSDSIAEKGKRFLFGRK
ncbi:uncharacterized protein DNG_03691 [Cephalotrichum gorgonifer]|uniref:Uncharacterized protein n=1 Tax=Cephalotrichum gorgonifer TaxID=2041049 RepID=A0AAE8STU1_9PEZI|nr:uncharacterized protein DNG_03691 [Cephalotrichum gorgonifer]